MTDESLPAGSRWSMVSDSLTRPYRVTLPMVVLVSLVPFYIFIAEMISVRPSNVPALTFDRLLPLQPGWAVVYGALYLWLIVLPVLVVRQEEHIRRTVLAYLTIWITAYVFFVLYPTRAPRPPNVIGEGFGVWGLQVLYGADPPYNCFPSLHVAHSFVSALTIDRVHRRVGVVAIAAAVLVALSTLFTKQHYVLDVLAGILLACAAFIVFLRGYARNEVPAIERRAAPILAFGVLGIAGLMVIASWIVYRLTS